MNIFLGFGPFILFAALMRLGDVLFALIAAAALSALLILRKRRRGKSIKILEAGTAVLFGALAIFSAVARYDWSIFEARLAVDLGLLIIVLGSIAARQPFTMHSRARRSLRNIGQPRNSSPPITESASFGDWLSW
jgi:intracellular septation protein A